jgi:hypothetical protein
MRRAALTALVAGFVVGTFLAALPYAMNEPCLVASEFPVENRNASVNDNLWPYGTNCELGGGYGGHAVEQHRAGVLEGIAWVALCSLLFALALIRRTPAAHGAAAAVTLLAVIGFLWQFGGEFAPFVVFLPTFAFLVPYVVLRWLRHGSRVRSALTAYVLTGTVSFVWVVGDFSGFRYLGIAAGIVAGALTVRAAARVGRARATTVVPAR